MKVKWEDAFEARPSKNVRDEDVFDIYRKDTEDMIYADIPPNSLDDIKKQMSRIIDEVAQQTLDHMFGIESSGEDYTEFKGLGNHSKGDHES